MKDLPVFFIWRYVGRDQIWLACDERNVSRATLVGVCKHQADGAFRRIRFRPAGDGGPRIGRGQNDGGPARILVPAPLTVPEPVSHVVNDKVNVREFTETVAFPMNPPEVAVIVVVPGLRPTA